MEQSDNRAIATFLKIYGFMILGAILSADAFLFLQNNALSLKVIAASSALVILGLSVSLCGLFWRRLGPLLGSRFVGRLGELASNPNYYIVLAALLWIYISYATVITTIQRNNDLAAVRNDEQSMAAVLRRTALPRRLTRNQQEAITNFLAQFPPDDYSIRAVDNEAAVYGRDIAEALSQAHWSQVQPQPNPNFAFSDGLTISFVRTPVDLKSQEDRNPGPSLLLQEAFGLAAVRLDGGTISESGLSGVTESYLEIRIGHYRMDDFTK